MKKLLLLIAAVASFASCVQNIEGVDNSLGYTTITVGMPESRTSLGAKDENGIYAIYWSDGDQIVVNGVASTRMEFGENRKSATFHFEGNLLTPPFYLTYPYTENSACAEGKPTVVFAANQEYVANSFGVGYAPMCGYIESGEASMMHLAGVLQFKVKGTNKLSTIEIVAEEGKALAGEFDVDCKEATISPITATTTNTITYTANQTLTTDGVVFHITVPKGIEGVCKVVLTDSAGQKMNLKWTASNVAAGVVREFKEFSFKGGASFELEEMSSITDDLEVEERDTWKIYYTATAKVEPYETDVFGANIVSNVYENGKGVITFDGDVTSIGKYAFYNCTSLTSVTIGNSVTSIGHQAFDLCISLTSVTIPDSVTSIGESAFRDCTSLTSVTIPDSVTSIGNGAFSSCSSLKAFYGEFASSDNRCLIIDGLLNSFAPAGLTQYTIPDSVTSIGGLAFRYCSSLTSVTIPNSVTSIDKYAFYNCTSLTSVTIPDSVTLIGGSAFGECTSLTSVYCKPTTPPTAFTWISWNAFDNNASGRKIYVPRNSVEAYKSASYWSNYADYIEGYDF